MSGHYLEVFVSTDCLDLKEGIVYPENGKHPIRQVEWVEDFLSGVEDITDKLNIVFTTFAEPLRDESL